MKTTQFTLLILCISFFGFAQVGVGNTDPKASLDVSASNVASPSNEDGILIPRIDNFPTTNPAADQDGMMVFVTGNGTPTKGFYYWDNTLTNWISVVGTKNTLDQAYNEGGAGTGKNIDATNGAVRINGTDGFLVTGTTNSGNTIDTEITGAGTRMFFNPRNAAFRAGSVTGSEWDHSNIGLHSLAVGNNVTASGTSSVAMGSSNQANGTNSIAMGSFAVANAIGSKAIGYNINAHSFMETVMGTYSTDYTPVSTTLFNNSDRLFVIGNGTHPNINLRSNALTIYKNGLMNINDEYNMPLTDGINGQVMTTDGAGNISFQNITGDGDTQNTLNQAYDEGGPGVGRTITADNGAVRIAGTDGFIVQGSLNNGATIQSQYGSILSSGMLFNPRRGSFFAGRGNLATLSDGFIGDYSMSLGFQNAAFGDYSVAMGYFNTASGIASFSSGQDNTASGNHSSAFGLDNTSSGVGSTAFGTNNTASGNRAFSFGNDNSADGENSLAAGIGNTSPSFSEVTLGTFANSYVANNTINVNVNDQLFALGNGINNTTRSNALTIYKSGLMNINDAYNMPLTDGTNGQVMTTDGAGNISFQNITGDGDTQNTLNQAYDEGGPGVGRTITADNGAVTINGTDGILVTGTLGSGNTIDDEITGDGIRMFFNPHKAAYRGGMAENDWWIDSRIGNYSFSHGRQTWVAGEHSVAFGRETTANGDYAFAGGLDNDANGDRSFVYGFVSGTSGDYAVSFGNGNQASGLHGFTQGEGNDASGDYTTAFGRFSNANGDFSRAFGYNLNAESYGETVLGLYNTDYSENSSTAFNSNDRLFVVGNGTSNTARSNALTIYKSGLMNINDAYNMPLTDGTNGQVMTTDGAGNVTFEDLPTFTDTDNQQIDTFNFNTSTNILTLEMEDDGQLAQTVDLSSLNNSGTDDQQIDSFSFNSTTNILSLEVENDGQAAQTVDLSSLNPQKAIARITMSAAQTETGSGTTKVNFDNEDFDIGNNFNLTNDNFVVPADGLYRVTAQLTISASTGTGLFAVRVRINNAQQRRQEFNHHGNGPVVRQVTSIISLTAGDTIDVSFLRPAVGATIEANSRGTFFEIEQL